MRESLRKLVALQQVDDDLARVRTELEALPKRRAAAEAEREAAEAALAEARGSLAAAERRVRELEAQVEDTEAHKQRLEGQSAMAKSNLAYTALMSEIAHAKERIEQLEAQEYEAIEAVDTARESLAAREKAARAVGARVREELARLEALGAELAKESERLELGRDEAASRLDPELYARYEKVAERRRPAVALISGEICSGCRVGIPPQSIVNMLSGQSIVACGSCKRILVHESALAGWR